MTLTNAESTSQQRRGGRVMPERPVGVLFLCTHNSARSVLAECIINRLGQGMFKGYSAGSYPSGTVNPHAIKFLERTGYDTSGLRSKSWDEFARPDAPPIDYVLTVCDDAAGETCPIWPGRPTTAHWGIADPSRAEGSDADRQYAFAMAHRALRRRISSFLLLPLVTMDPVALRSALDAIGRDTEGASPGARRPAGA